MASACSIISHWILAPNLFIGLQLNVAIHLTAKRIVLQLNAVQNMSLLQLNTV